MEILSQAFRALGDPTRLRILKLLARSPLNVSELVSLIGVAQSSVSHHLGRLKQLDLVREERQAGFTFYSVALDSDDARWPLIQLAQNQPDGHGDAARLQDLLRQREDRQALNERLLEPGQSWSLWAGALAHLLPKWDVADFGCGSGALTVAIARWANRVVAVDQSASALSRAKQQAQREGLRNIEFRKEDLQKLSVPSRALDLVVMSQSLHHVESPPRVLSEACRVLKRGGRAIVLDLLPHQEEWVKERLGHKHLGFEPEQLEHELTQVGFNCIAHEVHAKEGNSPFRVFLLVGVKR